MTQARCRCECHAVSNRLDEVLRGIGHRGSSFTDVDGYWVGLVDDGRHHRQLMVEAKRGPELMSDGQHRALVAFSDRPGRQAVQLRWDSEGKWILTAWAFGAIRDGMAGVVLDDDGLRRWFAAWWEGEPDGGERKRDGEGR